MRRLVEDAGDPLSVSALSFDLTVFGRGDGLERVGGREVGWRLGDEAAVTLTHLPADRRRRPVSYTVGIESTVLPSGGCRWWWSCPGCGRRAGLLYLPPDRDCLGCRKCCGLVYASQYPGRGAGKPKKPREATTVVGERRTWTPAAGWVRVRWRRTRR